MPKANDASFTSSEPTGPDSDDDLSDLLDLEFDDSEPDERLLARSLRTPWQELPVSEEAAATEAPARASLPFSINLGNGGHAWLDDLIQTRTYSGQLLGMPLSDPTREFLSALRAIGCHFQFYAAAPCILAPTMRRQKQDAKDQDPVRRFRLPHLRSIALFTSADLVKEEAYSSVAVIWYQDGFGLPDDHVVTQLRDIDWGAHAVEWMP